MLYGAEGSEFLSTVELFSKLEAASKIADIQQDAKKLIYKVWAQTRTSASSMHLELDPEFTRSS